MELIVTTAEQLEAVINKAVFRALNLKQQSPQLPDRCNFDEAIKITGLSKSKLYKLTAAKEIPFKVFGSRLIFSRKELSAWVESQTKDKNNINDIDLALARSARNKRG